MKRIITVAVILLSLINAYAQNGRSIYQEYSDAKGISAVYVSPSMFRLIGRIPDIEAGDGSINLTPIIRSLNGLYILSSENAEINVKLSKDVNKFIASGKFELLMEAKEDGEKVTMFTSGDEKTITSFVLLSDEGDELTFICIDGKMDRAQLEDILSEQIK